MRLSKSSLKKEKGAVALEAMLCIVFMFVVFYILWGVATLIYNQSKLNTATQFAAQGALIAYDRSDYRGGSSARAAYAEGRAKDIAEGLYSENSCGMLADPFTGKVPNSTCQDGSAEELTSEASLQIEIQCAPALNPEDGGFPSPVASIGNTALQDNCTARDIERARALRVVAVSEGEDILSILSPGDNPFGANKETEELSLNSVSAAYSYSPKGLDND